MSFTSKSPLRVVQQDSRVRQITLQSDFGVYVPLQGTTVRLQGVQYRTIHSDFGVYRTTQSDSRGVHCACH